MRDLLKGKKKRTTILTFTAADGIKTGISIMVFSISSKELCEVLVNISRVVNSKNVLPILDNIVFSVSKDILTLKASDGENTLTADITLPKAAEEEGTFSVNAKNITEAIKNLPDTPLEFSTDKAKMAIMVDYFTGKFSLPITDGSEFPIMSDMNENNTKTFTIPEGMLQENIARSIFATANEELRPVMNGIYFDFKTENLTVVASDGHLLVRNIIHTIKAADDGSAGGFILPKKPSQILKTILRRTSEDNVTVSFDGSQAIIKAETYTMQCKLIEGRYPNYNSVIPQNNSMIVIANRASLIAVLKRVSPFSNENSQLICVHVEPGKMQLSTEDYDFSMKASEDLTCNYDGDTMDIGLKGPKVLEILNNINSEEVEIQMADPARPVLILPVEQPDDMDVLMLQMPMLIA